MNTVSTTRASRGGDGVLGGGIIRALVEDRRRRAPYPSAPRVSITPSRMPHWLLKTSPNTLRIAGCCLIGRVANGFNRTACVCRTPGIHAIVERSRLIWRHQSGGGRRRGLHPSCAGHSSADHRDGAAAGHLAATCAAISALSRAGCRRLVSCTPALPSRNSNDAPRNARAFSGCRIRAILAHLRRDVRQADAIGRRPHRSAARLTHRGGLRSLRRTVELCRSGCPASPPSATSAHSACPQPGVARARSAT